MSMLSSLVKKVRKDLHLPAITLKNIAGIAAGAGVGAGVGAIVTGTLAGIGKGQSPSQAASAATQAAGTRIANEASTAAQGIQTGYQVSQATTDLLHGPVPWIVIGLALAGILSHGGKK